MNVKASKQKAKSNKFKFYDEKKNEIKASEFWFGSDHYKRQKLSRVKENFY